MGKKFSEEISVFQMNSKDSVELLCKAIKNGAEIVIERISTGETAVVWKDGKFRLKKTGELLSEMQFMRLTIMIPDDPSWIILRRADLMPEYQRYSDTEIARKLGDSSLALTLTEMSEEGRDIWE